jgi:DNA-directed RNA polymerase specialized sigma24 family protein
MPRESLQILLDRWQTGDQTAATDIFERYQQRIVQRAKQRLGPVLRTKVQPESIMLLVLESALRGIAEGRYAAENSRAFLNLLDQVTENKIRKKWEYYIAQKRDIRREVRAEQAVETAELPQPHRPIDEAAVLADELEKIRSRLKLSLFAVFQLLLEGHSYEEIAERLGLSWHTIYRRVKRIEELMKEWSGGGKMDSF